MGDGDPVGSIGPTAIGLAEGPVASTSAEAEPPFAASVARNEGASVGEGEGELVANMPVTRPRAIAATRRSATNRGLDRADCRFIRLHPLFGCLG